VAVRPAWATKAKWATDEGAVVIRVDLENTAIYDSIMNEE
jgi:hypothetical protein